MILIFFLYSIKLFTENPVVITPRFTSLVQNNYGGGELIFSNNQTYEISPSDQEKTAGWISPIDVKIEASDDPNYPFLITNIQSNEHVRAKLMKDIPR